jgi:hypothetical protein
MGDFLVECAVVILYAETKSGYSSDDTTGGNALPSQERP